ncbi:MAG: EamA family transporter [Myxococcota bacterium]
MTLLELLLALTVVFVWGTNFVVIRYGLADFPPLVFATLRFTLAALPWLFFIRRPPVAWRYLAAVGVLLGVGQFGLLFIAMRNDIAPGLASLVIQVQVFFTVGLSVWLFDEAIHLANLLGLALGIAGLWLIGAHVDASTTLKGLGLVGLAALSWALANLVVKAAVHRHGPFNTLAFMVWSSVFAVPPLAALAVVFEGPATAMTAIARADLAAWAAVLWQALGNTLFGYGVWNWLLTRHSAATFTPAALLVPVFGLGASSLILGEPLQGWKLAAAGLIVAGLAINLIDPVKLVRRGR